MNYYYKVEIFIGRGESSTMQVLRFHNEIINVFGNRLQAVEKKLQIILFFAMLSKVGVILNDLFSKIVCREENFLRKLAQHLAEYLLIS